MTKIAFLSFLLLELLPDRQLESLLSLYQELPKNYDSRIRIENLTYRVILWNMEVGLATDT